MHNPGKNPLWQPILDLGAAVINKVRYGTAMDTILILVCLVTLPSLIIFSFVIQFWPLLLIAVAPLFQFMRVYDYFMKHNPQMLRTEKHEETMLRIASGFGSQGRELTEEIVDALPSSIANKSSLKNKPKLLVAKKRER